MAAIFADAAVFGFKALSTESPSSSYDEKICFSPELWSNLKPQDPCPCIQTDFIIFAEFSEVMGPIPLLTIPLQAAERCGIEINNFIMRIMSVDYQASPRYVKIIVYVPPLPQRLDHLKEHISGSVELITDDMLGCIWQELVYHLDICHVTQGAHIQHCHSVFCEDAQVLRMFVMPNVHAYVHYLTLHDPGARGFVRPLCLAYVTADQYKLSQLFPKLRKQFLQVTEAIKYNNRLWFRDEIKSILHCIKETQYKYLSWKKKEEDGAMISEEGRHILDHTNMDQLVQQSTDFTHMLHALDPLLKADSIENSVLIEKWKRGFEEAKKSDMILSVYSITSRIGNSTNHLKGILALSPWGLSAAIWNLLSLLACHRECRLRQHSTTATLQDWVVLKNNVDEALNDTDFMQLMSSLSRPPDLKPATPYRAMKSDRSQDSLEANIMSSGNEVASSYHSVPESLSEILACAHISSDDEVNKGEEVFPGQHFVDDASSNDSFLDMSETSSMTEDNWSATSPYQAEEKQTHCIWSCQKSSSGLLEFFQSYNKAAHHILYSLLIGRTVVFVGCKDSELKASLIMTALSPYVPVMPGQEVKILRWRCGTLMPAHISSYHMIGVCIPERLSVHDMISPKDKNFVTILDVNSKQLFGPAYSGQLLSSLERIIEHMPSDQTLVLYMQTIAASLNEKLFMYLTLLKMKPPPEKSQSSPGSEVLREIRLEGCDAEIVRNLSKIESVDWKPLQ